MAIAPIAAVTVAQPAAPQTVAPATGGQSFAAALDSVTQSTANADQLSTQMATGQLSNIQDFMSAATKAELAVSLTVAIRNRAVEAYQEIMRMQV